MTTLLTLGTAQGHYRPSELRLREGGSNPKSRSLTPVRRLNSQPRTQTQDRRSGRSYNQMADATLPTRRRALALGAKDFLTKPFDAIEVILRIFNLLETRVLMLELAKHGIDPPKSNRPLME